MFEFVHPEAVIVTINPGILWAIFGVILIGVGIVSLMLVYHWREYTYNTKIFGRAVFLYFVISGGLAASALISLLEFISSIQT